MRRRRFKRTAPLKNVFPKKRRAYERKPNRFNPALRDAFAQSQPSRNTLTYERVAAIPNYTK